MKNKYNSNKNLNHIYQCMIIFYIIYFEYVKNRICLYIYIFLYFDENLVYKIYKSISKIYIINLLYHLFCLSKLIFNENLVYKIIRVIYK